MQEPSKSIPAYTDTLLYTDYVLRPSDRIYVYVYSVDEKINSLFNPGGVTSRTTSMQSASSSDLYTYLVDNEGMLQFPTIGKIDVKGKTCREVKYLLEKQLSMLHSDKMPQGTIAVDVQVVQRFFSVIGANASGRFAISKEKITIFEALAMARDIADFGDRSTIKLVREVGDSTRVATFDVRSKDIINSEFYYVQAGDVIYIRKIKGYAFGMNSAAATVSVVATTISFGVLIYSFIDRYVVRPIKKSKEESNKN